MQRQITYRSEAHPRQSTRKSRVILGIIGGVLYLVMALAIMQVAFFVWAGMWR